jgi:hypothetical protein
MRGGAGGSRPPPGSCGASFRALTPPGTRPDAAAGGGRRTCGRRMLSRARRGRCVAGPGEVVYTPEGLVHLTLNLSETLFAACA